jgi:hypothetical protein
MQNQHLREIFASVDSKGHGGKHNTVSKIQPPGGRGKLKMDRNKPWAGANRFGLK